jgi:hypothetical protein
MHPGISTCLPGRSPEDPPPPHTSSADKTMMVTKGITCNNCDVGTCTGLSGLTCTGGAFFRVDQTYRGSSWYFNWLGENRGGGGLGQLTCFILWIKARGVR